jgi:hypothetical protein
MIKSGCRLRGPTGRLCQTTAFSSRKSLRRSASRSSPRVSKRAKPRLGISIAMQSPLTANSTARPVTRLQLRHHGDVAQPHGLLPSAKDRTSHRLELGPSEGPNDAGVALGQPEKNSVRAYGFRFTLKLGHCSMH